MEMLVLAACAAIAVAASISIVRERRSLARRAWDIPGSELRSARHRSVMGMIVLLSILVFACYLYAPNIIARAWAEVLAFGEDVLLHVPDQEMQLVVTPEEYGETPQGQYQHAHRTLEGYGWTFNHRMIPDKEGKISGEVGCNKKGDPTARHYLEVAYKLSNQLDLHFHSEVWSRHYADSLLTRLDCPGWEGVYPEKAFGIYVSLEDEFSAGAAVRAYIREEYEKHLSGSSGGDEFAGVLLENAFSRFSRVWYPDEVLAIAEEMASTIESKPRGEKFANIIRGATRAVGGAG